MHPAGVTVAPRPAAIFEFEDLAALPCGCVTSAFRAAEWGVTLVSIEAKGPHCILPDHFVGQVVHVLEDGVDDPESDLPDHPEPALAA